MFRKHSSRQAILAGTASFAIPQIKNLKGNDDFSRPSSAASMLTTGNTQLAAKMGRIMLVNSQESYLCIVKVFYSGHNTALIKDKCISFYFDWI